MPFSWRQIVHQVQVAPNLHDALCLIVHEIKDALSVDACAVYLNDVENDQFVLMASDGLAATSVGRRRVGPEGLVGLVAQRRELVVLDDTAPHPRYPMSPEGVEERYSCFIGVPLVYYDRVLGVLVAWKRIHRQFEKHEVTFFVTIAAHLAKAIHQASAVDEVNRMLRGEAQEGAFIQGIQAANGVAIGTVALL